MKVQEFVEYMKNNTNKTTREDQVLSMVKKQLNIKPYLSIKTKRNLIDNIIDACMLYDNGVFSFDGISKYVYFTMYTISAYTNLELSMDVEDDFDMLSESKLLPIVMATIQSEYDDVNILFQMQCDCLLEKNSVEANVGRLCDKMIELFANVENKINTIAGDAQIGNLDIEKILKNLGIS